MQKLREVLLLPTTILFPSLDPTFKPSGPFPSIVDHDGNQYYSVRPGENLPLIS